MLLTFLLLAEHEALQVEVCSYCCIIPLPTTQLTQLSWMLLLLPLQGGVSNTPSLVAPLIDFNVTRGMAVRDFDEVTANLLAVLKLTNPIVHNYATVLESLPLRAPLAMASLSCLPVMSTPFIESVQERDPRYPAAQASQQQGSDTDQQGTHMPPHHLGIALELTHGVWNQRAQENTHSAASQPVCVGQVFRRNAEDMDVGELC